MAALFCASSRRIRSTFSTLRNISRTRWFLGGTALGVFIFTVLRGIPAWPLQAYGMNIWVFVLIDLITAYPYVWCIKNIVTGLRSRKWWQLTMDGVILAASFAAPYLYILWSAGQAMPVWVVVVVISVVATLALVGPIRKIVEAVKGVR